MKAAFAIFGSRISPRFDCTQDFILVTFSGNEITSRFPKTLKEKRPLIKAQCLADLGVDTVVCGGFDKCSIQSLEFHGINVIANIRGEVEDVLYSYLQDQFEQ